MQSQPRHPAYARFSLTYHPPPDSRLLRYRTQLKPTLLAVSLRLSNVYLFGLYAILVDRELTIHWGKVGFNEHGTTDGAKTEVFLGSAPPRCRINTSQKNYWITSSTSYRIREIRSRVVPSFRNRGSRELASTSSPISSSLARRASNHGKPPFRIPPPLPHIMPGLYLLSIP